MPPSRLTPDVFVGLIRQSKLVDEAVLKNALREMLSLAGVTKDPVKIAEELVNRKLLTRWQADKLLQGRNKGFFSGSTSCCRTWGGVGPEQSTWPSTA